MSTSAPQRLLRDFYKREARRLASLPQSSSSLAAVSAASTSTSPSTSSSTSLAIPSSAPQSQDPSQLQWTTSTNPFIRRRKPDSASNEGARSSWLKPVYSIRRQKMLIRALGEVQLVDSLSAGPGAPSFSWKLPQGPKSDRGDMKSLASVGLGESVQREQMDPWKQGPYKGRAKTPFKQHKWERQRESIKAERQEKLRNMPMRIADYVKTRAAAKASTKPGLPF